MQVVFMLSMLGDQNTAGLVIVLGPNNCQGVRSDVLASIDKADWQLRDTRRELIIPRQSINNAAMNFVLLDFNRIHPLKNPLCVNNVLDSGNVCYDSVRRLISVGVRTVL